MLKIDCSMTFYIRDIISRSKANISLYLVGGYIFFAVTFVMILITICTNRENGITNLEVFHNIKSIFDLLFLDKSFITHSTTFIFLFYFLKTAIDAENRVNIVLANLNNIKEALNETTFVGKFTINFA